MGKAARSVVASFSAALNRQTGSAAQSMTYD
jgi:hypothetical protein